jgi:nicotinamidase-related amidase
MKIPFTKLKKALLIVDVQDSFINIRNKYIIPNIKKIIENVYYDLIVYSISKNEK